MTNFLKLLVAATIISVGIGNTYAQKKPKLIKAVLADGEFTISTVCLQNAVNKHRHVNLQEELRLYRVVAWKIDQTERRNVLQKVQQFVAQNERWMRTKNTTLEEARLAKTANILIKDGQQEDPTIAALGALRQTAEQTEQEKQTLAALEDFIATHQRFPRMHIIPISGKVNQVADMSATQIAEFQLASQIEHIQAKDPAGTVAQKIQALKEKWTK